jgi:hypothetical protein
MRKRSILTGGALAAALAGLALCLPHDAAAQTPDNDWHFTLGLDGWAPTINGKLKYSLPPGTGTGGGVTLPPEVEVGPNKYLKNLKAVVPVFAEARKGKFSFLADVIYLSLGGERSSVIGAGLTVPVDVKLNSSTSTSIKGTMGALVAGFAVADSAGGRLDVIGGVRYLGLRTTTNWQLSADITGPGGGVVLAKTGSISQRVDLWDGVAGVKGRVNLGEHWFLPYYADIGTGTSSLTYQLDGGVAYAWSWGNTGLMFRHLYYDQKDDKLIQGLKFSGPELTLAFRF